MTLSDLRRAFSIARKRNLTMKQWFVSQDEYDDLKEELKDFCTKGTYVEDGEEKGMLILGVKIKIKDLK